jgi:hypothetical protein
MVCSGKRERDQGDNPSPRLCAHSERGGYARKSEGLGSGNVAMPHDDPVSARRVIGPLHAMSALPYGGVSVQSGNARTRRAT